MKKLIFSILFLSLSFQLQASILWVGGEDIDFPNGSAVCNTTNSSRFRSGYARQAIASCTYNQLIKSTSFSGGGITSAWMSFRRGYGYYCADFFVGLGKSGTSKGLFLGRNGSCVWALYKYDGTTWTEVSTAATAMCTGALPRYDIQLTSYGVVGNVKVYESGSGCSNSQTTPIINYTGDLTLVGVTDLDSVYAQINNGWTDGISEIIVSSDDTRSMSLVTLAPSAAGDTNAWTGGNYTNVNTDTANDGSPISSNVSADKFQCNVNDLPSSGLSVVAVKVTARGSTGGTGMTSLSVGVKTNGSVNAPTAIAQSGVFNSTETYYLTNPITSSAWTTSEVNNLQINLQPAL